jgi:hypothetical protein
MHRANRATLIAFLALSAAMPARAQDIERLSVTAVAENSPATKAMLTAALIATAASGTQLLQFPDAWPRTWNGYGYRVADQTGFYIVQTTTFSLLSSATDYRQDVVLCPKATVVRCSFVATFTAFDRRGVRRVNVPLISSILVGTGASLAWRPERSDNGKSWAFVGTRLGVAFGGYVAERLVLDWWAQRDD